MIDNKRIPWSDTPEGKEHVEFVKRAKEGRPTVDESLCFVCQEITPTWQVTRKKETFQVCDSCKNLLEAENRKRNRIKQALNQGRGGNILTMTLGINLLPTQMKFENLVAKDK